MPATFSFSIGTPPPIPASPGRFSTIYRRAPTGITTETPDLDVSEVPTQLGWDSYYQRTELSGTEYLLLFQYNERSDAWYFSLFYTDGVAIVESKKLTLNTDLLLTVVDQRRPPGVLQLTSIEPENYNEPTRDDLGVKYVLLYAEFADA